MTVTATTRWILVGLTAMLLVVSACGMVPAVTVEQIPLPAPGNLGDTITVTAEFDDALNLPARAKVKQAGTDIGEVTAIRAENYKAVVTMRVAASAHIAAGTGAELRQATPLGDVFVSLVAPVQRIGAPLGDGAALTGPRSAAATVEDLLVSMSGLVDSGSLGSTQQILTELSAAVSHGTDTPHQLSGAIAGFTTAISKLNRNAAAVDSAVGAVRVLTAQLADGRAQLMASISKLGPAFSTINNQIGIILTALDKTAPITAASNDFLRSDQRNLTDLIEHLATLLDGLNEAAVTLGPLAQNLAALTPRWAKSMSSSGASLSMKVYWLNPGAGFDSASRIPELDDLRSGTRSLQQTLTHILARLTGSGQGQR